MGGRSAQWPFPNSDNRALREAIVKSGSAKVLCVNQLKALI